MDKATKVGFQRYEAFKDSGVEWLGEIPYGWEVNRLKSKIALLTGFPFKSDKYTKAGIKLARGINVKEGYFDWTDAQYWPEVTKDLEPFLLAVGDVLIAMDGSKVGKNFCKVDRDALPILLLQRVARLRTREGLLPNFLYWNIVSRSFLTWVNISKTDPMVPHIAPKDINNFIIAFPPLPEQTAIARFLDEKTAKIDAAIAKKERLIQLLKERKQIMIQQVVTKGLDPNVKMKDSGVDWIGEIPEVWEVKALKFIANMQSGETISPEKFLDEGYPVYGGNGFRGYTDRYTNEGDFALIGRQGALCGNVNYVSSKFYASEHAIVVYPIRSQNVLWLGEIIKVADFNRLSQSAAQPGIAVNVIKNEIFVEPLMDEQDEIAEHIKRVNLKTNQSISLQQTQIEKLKEYKATLIDSAVTGKIKVPEL